MKTYLETVKYKIVSCHIILFVFIFSFSLTAHAKDDHQACIDMAKGGLLKIADDRSKRFMGKVEEDTARCRGGEKPIPYLDTPWVDWSNYYSAGDAGSRHEGREAITKLGEHLYPNGRGIDGALIDLEYQRIELIKFNLFDQDTYQDYILGRNGQAGSTLKFWDEMRLSPDHKNYQDVGGKDKQLCQGDLITHRTLTGICNDLINPLMGSSGMTFGRNMQFDTTFPRLGLNELTQNRHGQRIGLLKPDPQLISRKLFTREQTSDNGCHQGQGDKHYSNKVDCDYLKAPFFNVLAAFWIQFMTHDWFSHTIEGHNKKELTSVGCSSAEARALGCRSKDRREPSLYAKTSQPASFTHDGQTYAKRSPKTTHNQVTAWWDASQIYGHDERSLKRVQRDPQDPAKLLLINNYLPLLPACDQYTEDCPVQSQWLGQEAAGFPANWSIGTSFYHNLFTREHNYFVDQFRALQKQSPDADSGLRNPQQPKTIIRLKDVDDERLFQVARLVVAAEIAKIHTIEWTTQLLYDEPLFAGMNSNWYGLFNHDEDRVSQILRRLFDKDENILSRKSEKAAGALATSSNAKKANSIYSVLASGAGIFGLGNKKMKGWLWWKKDAWDLKNLEEDVNGGINHFGSPFNFPEEFTSVYRLHALVPDLIEYREAKDPNKIALKIPVVNTVRGKATDMMQQRGIESWALSMGRQRLGLLHLKNQPLFLQNLPMPQLNSETGKLDIVALDLIRDRERGVPRFNEFRRQIGLRTLSSFDDFIDQRLDENDPWRKHQENNIVLMREIYGTHTCDAGKIISKVQRNKNGNFINDCLGHPDGSIVDNIEDVDNIVGWLSEYTRPHGFAISETQFHIFIINASRRLFSDRFFTSSFRPEFYSTLGYDWLLNDGLLSECPYPVSTQDDGQQACQEPEKINGHVMRVSPLKRILLRNIPELKEELLAVKNVFDPWARDRGEFYSLDWQARHDATMDSAFSQ